MTLSKPVDLQSFVKRTNFRGAARRHLSDAKYCMAQADDRYLFYAALEIRKCMEALIYETAKVYVEDIPTDDFATWQPGRLLARLLEIDPMADRSGEIRFAREDQDEPMEWHSLGENKRLTLEEIRQNYDALGFYLHTLTIHQRWKGKAQKLDRLRVRCEMLVARLEDLLSATVWNFNMQETATLNCAKCGSVMRRRVGAIKEPAPEGGVSKMTVNCFDCSASYILSLTEDGRVLWDEDLVDVPCPNEECDNTLGVWRRDIREGMGILCGKCNLVGRFGLGMWAEKNANS